MLIGFGSCGTSQGELSRENPRRDRNGLRRASTAIKDGSITNFLYLEYTAIYIQMERQRTPEPATAVAGQPGSTARLLEDDDDKAPDDGAVLENEGGGLPATTGDIRKFSPLALGGSRSRIPLKQTELSVLHLFCHFWPCATQLPPQAHPRPCLSHPRT